MILVPGVSDTYLVPGTVSTFCLFGFGNDNYQVSLSLLLSLSKLFRPYRTETFLVSISNTRTSIRTGIHTPYINTAVLWYAIAYNIPCILVYNIGLTLTFQLLDKLWSQVSSLLPNGTCLQFLSRIGFSIPTARRLSLSNVGGSRFRAFRE